MKYVGLVGLLATVVILTAIVWFAYGQKEPGSNAASVAAAASGTLGAPPPTDIAKNAAAAKEYTQHQTCLADCAASHRTCAATATEPAETTACDDRKRTCDQQCP